VRPLIFFVRSYIIVLSRLLRPKCSLSRYYIGHSGIFVHLDSLIIVFLYLFFSGKHVVNEICLLKTPYQKVMVDKYLGTTK